VTPASRPLPARGAVEDIGRRSNVDLALTISGVLIAASSLAFAGYMFNDANRKPQIAGMEYLGIFARPTHPAAVAAAEPAAEPVDEEAPAKIAAQAIDPTPTGSIANKDVTAPINPLWRPSPDIDPREPPSSYKLLDVANGEALIQSDVGFRHVKVGDRLPDLGRIDAIEKRGANWVLTTQTGAALEWLAPAPRPAATGAAPSKKTSPR
jgi:hypothetical protein